MTRKPTDKERDFTDSFLWRVPLRKGRKHSLKSHARRGTLVHEVLGILDLLADKDPQRFVFAGVPAILKVCNKGRRADAKTYSIQHLKRVLAELRERHLISPYFKTWDGRYGLVVEPHDCRCRVVDNVCFKYAPKRFECRPEDEILFRDWRPNGAQVETAKETGWRPGWRPQGRPTSGNKETLKETVLETDVSVQPDDFTNFTEADAAKWLADRGLTGPPNRVAVESVSLEPKNRRTAVSSDQGQAQGQPQEQKQERTGVESCSLPRLTDEEAKSTARPTPMMTTTPAISIAPVSAVAPGETIGEHFAMGVTIDRLTNGGMDDDTEDTQDVRNLLVCMKEAVAAKAEHPYCGLITNAGLMRDAMKMLRKVYGKDVPTPWLPIMDEFRGRSGEQKSEAKRARLLRSLQQPPIASDWHKANGYELCEDNIWRPKLDRDNHGFVVKAANGIWCKA